ncbi:MAG: DUF3857 domain-containing protein [Terriglobales bacterium]
MLAAVAAAAATPHPVTAQQLVRNAQAYLVSPALLRDQTAQFGGQGSVQLYHLRYEQVVPSGLSALLLQRVFQIRSREGAAMFAPDNLWYDSARGHFQLIRAEVWRRKGKRSPYQVVAQGKDLGDLPGFAIGTEPRRLGLPRLHAGDRVSVVYAILPDAGQDWSLLGGHFIGNMFAFRDSFATERVRYVLAARQPMAASGAGLAAPELGSGVGGLRTWSWQASGQPAFFQSPGGPAITDVSPFVQVSSFTTWSAMAAWYSSLLSQRAQIPPALAAELRKIGAPVGAAAPAGMADRRAAQTQAIVARVWSYLSRHLSYRGVEQGVHAYVPAPVAEVFAREQGDCKDGALLLVTWLRSLGVQADVALVRTPAMGPLAPANAAGQVAATMAAFDHALVYIPATGQWIDTTAPKSPDADLPQGDRNSLALIVRTGQHKLVRVDPAVAQTKISATATVRLTSAQVPQP